MKCFHVLRLKDDSLTDLEMLPEPDVIAWEIIENLEAGLKGFKKMIKGLKGSK